MTVDFSPEGRRARRAERAGAKLIGVASELGAVGFAWALWGWKGAALLFCLGLAREARDYI